MWAEVAGGEVRGLRPDPDHPTTRGRLCPKARFQLDRHRSALRFRTPLVRSGGRLKSAGWETALDLVAEKLLQARRRYGSPAVLHYWDSGSMGLLKGLWNRLFNLFGGVTEPYGSLCWSAGLAAQEADFGRVLAHSPEDLDRAGGVVLWGRNPADTSPHLMPFLRKARERGCEVVVIDPVRTATVRELDARHLAVRPGTDAVLALAVAGQLLRCGTYDRAFCEQRAAGFSAFASAARGLDPGSAASFCGLDRREVLCFADFLAARVAAVTGTPAEGRGRGGWGTGPDGPAAFLIGYGLQRHSLGGEAVRAVDALAALAGSIGRPGGGANYANRHAQGVLADLGCPDSAPARRYFRRARFGREVLELAGLGAGGPPVTVLVCERANPAAQLPDTNAVVAALRAVPFKVVAELVPTDTTALADVVLPVADFLEDEDLYFCSWHSYFTWAVPAVDPPDGVRSETRIIRDLALRLGLGEAFSLSPAQWIIRALEPLVRRYPELAPGGRVETLRGTWFKNPAAATVPWAEGPFATASGRFEFGRRWRCLDLMRDPEGLEEGGRAGGLYLITPQGRYNLHSQFYEKTLERTSSDGRSPAVYVNPVTARRLGLDEGDRVLATTEQGSLEGRLRLDPGVRSDTVLIYSGGSVGLVGGRTLASANVLTPERETDLGNQAALYSCRCVLGPAPKAGLGPAPKAGRLSGPFNR